MKKILFIGIAIAVLVGCQSGKIEVQKEKQNDHTEMWEISIVKSLFSSTDVEYTEKCKVINHRLTALIDSLVGSFKNQVVDYNNAFDTIPDEQPLRPLEMFVEDSVFMVNTNYISLRVKVYTSLGGANGETGFYAENFDLNKQRFLSKGEILNLNQAEAIDRSLKGEFKNPDQCFADEPTIGKCSVLNFTDKEVCFTYGKYVLGPGACGFVTIDIERSKLDHFLLIK